MFNISFYVSIFDIFLTDVCPGIGGDFLDHNQLLIASITVDGNRFVATFDPNGPKKGKPDFHGVLTSHCSGTIYIPPAVFTNDSLTFLFVYTPDDILKFTDTITWSKVNISPAYK